MYNYHKLVSLLFSLHECISLNQNNDWCLDLDAVNPEIVSPDDSISWQWNSTGH